MRRDGFVEAADVARRIAREKRELFSIFSFFFFCFILFRYYFYLNSCVLLIDNWAILVMSLKLWNKRRNDDGFYSLYTRCKIFFYCLKIFQASLTLLLR